MTTSGRLARIFVLAVLSALTATAWACTSSTEAAKGGEAKTPEGAKELEHQKCDESMGRVEVLDTDHDGKPELKQVFDKSTNRELCRMADLNHDGKPDMYEYYNADATL